MATHVKPRENSLRWYKTARSLHLGRSGRYRVLGLVVVIDYMLAGGIDIDVDHLHLSQIGFL